MTVLVTGAAGRVGANVVQRLRTSGFDVRAMVTPGSTHSAKLSRFPDLNVVEADLRDMDSVKIACRGVTHVVHLAAHMVVDGHAVDSFYDVNTLGTLRLLEGVLHESTEFQRFVLASTDSTYRPGSPPAIPLTEEVEQRPSDYYGTSKLLSEILLRNRAEQFGIPYSIVRFGTVLSPEEAHLIYRLRFLRGWLHTQQSHGRRSNLWPLFDGLPDQLAIFDDQVGTADEDAAVSLVGPDGPWTLSVVDVRDAAHGVELALTAPQAVGRAFNIAAAEPNVSTDAARYMAELYDVPHLLVRLPKRWRLELSIDAARQYLGYEPVFDYQGTLRSAMPGAEGADYVPAAEGADGVFAKLAGPTASASTPSH